MCRGATKAPCNIQLKIATTDNPFYFMQNKCSLLLAGGGFEGAGFGTEVGSCNKQTTKSTQKTNKTGQQCEVRRHEKMMPTVHKTTNINKQSSSSRMVDIKTGAGAGGGFEGAGFGTLASCNKRTTNSTQKRATHDNNAWQEGSRRFE